MVLMINNLQNSSNLQPLAEENTVCESKFDIATIPLEYLLLFNLLRIVPLGESNLIGDGKSAFFTVMEKLCYPQNYLLFLMVEFGHHFTPSWMLHSY
jgi:hypothetical protein